VESEKNVSGEVRNFILKYIHSVEELEILLFLHKSKDSLWPVPEVHRYIQSNETNIANKLDELCSHGFLTAEKMPGLVYRFAPNTNELRQAVENLASAYQERRIQVLQLVCQRSENEIRNFSDAFKIRKEKNDS
jgi:hypothetical protein